MAIKRVNSNLLPTFAMTFHNFEDNKELNFSGVETHDTNTWVPFQSSGKQIKIQIRDKSNNYAVMNEFYLWDENYKLQCSMQDGVKTILTVTGSRDVGLNVSTSGVQAYLM
ncbi:hypothetical protein [Brasilonema sp. UFV-L1]|uniref:hypothetical protein n=1 Tax=Brasilonema sp. UFV-L1 TaxID=2234130 RepID=UPI00145D6A51|nr:hypothetical protein [Brasilonema sp. UFV-L1]